MASGDETLKFLGSPKNFILLGSYPKVAYFSPKLRGGAYSMGAYFLGIRIRPNGTLGKII